MASPRQSWRRAKAKLLRQYQSNYDERNNIENDAFAQGYLQHFLTGAIPTGAADDYALAQELLPSITLSDVNDRLATLYAPDNRAVVLVAPKKEGVTLPDEAALTALLDDVAAQQYEPYAGSEVSGELVENPPAPAAITSEETLPDLGITHITLDNGIQVYLKPTDFKDDEVILSSTALAASQSSPTPTCPPRPWPATWSPRAASGTTARPNWKSSWPARKSACRPISASWAKALAARLHHRTSKRCFNWSTCTRRSRGWIPMPIRSCSGRWMTTSRTAPLTPAQSSTTSTTRFSAATTRACSMMAVYKRVDEVDPDQALELYKQRFADLDDSVFVLAGACSTSTRPSNWRRPTWARCLR